MHKSIVIVAFLVAIFSTDITVVNGDTIECAAVKCIAPDCDNPITNLGSGQCCPFCPGCRDKAEALSKKTPCHPCTCKTGKLTCEWIFCTAVFCDKPVQPAGQCCPKCL